MLGQTAQWYAPQREWYLISPSRYRAEVWQTNGFAVSRMFSGGAGWAEIQRRCLCVAASAKHNKTLWGMNQTQTDRDSKAHMLIHSVNFTITLPLSPSHCFTLPTFLSYIPINWPFILMATVVGLTLCLLALQVCWVSWLLLSLLCQPDSKEQDQQQPFF